MKPRRRPGKVVTDGKANRLAFAKAVPVSESQMEHIRKKEPKPKLGKKEGRGGKRAHWDLDYEEGVEVAKKEMPNESWPNYSLGGIRKLPKRGGTKM